MKQGIREIGLFFAGWILALTTYFLSPLDTGLWVPFAVIGAEILGFSLMLFWIRQISDQHRYFKKAAAVAGLALFASVGMGAIQALSLSGITEWMAILAICLVVTGDVLFLFLTGLVLLGLSDRIRLDGKEGEANRLAYLWAIFLTFAILYLMMQMVAVLLVNEGLSALTYVVPAAGMPLLIVGAVLVVQVYRIHAKGEQEVQ